LYEDAAKFTVPYAGTESPEIVTVVLPGLEIVAEALGSLKVNSNVLLPVKGVAFGIDTEMVFGVESFSAHCKLPDSLEKSLPVVAVPAAVAYETLTAEVVPPVRLTTTETDFALWATV
jgi:hypothetical protein